MTPGPPHLVVEWGGSLCEQVDRAFAARVLETALRAARDPRLAGHGTWLLSVSVVDDEEIAALNAQYRGIPSPTDVLSFPQLDEPPRGEPPRGGPPPGVRAPAQAHGGSAASAVPLVLGDIVVSLPRAHAQAAEYGHPVQRELGYLLVHSVLHLLGHDHEDQEERRVMRAEEERILALLALSRPGEGAEHA